MLLTQPMLTAQKKKVFLEDNLKYGKEIERDYNKLQDILDVLREPYIYRIYKGKLIRSSNHKRMIL